MERGRHERHGRQSIADVLLVGRHEQGPWGPPQGFALGLAPDPLEPVAALTLALERIEALP
jgi:hypothetical protein